jgi:hypothetical protein
MSSLTGENGGSAGASARAATPGAIDAGELAERLRELRQRFDEFRGRL